MTKPKARRAPVPKPPTPKTTPKVKAKTVPVKALAAGAKVAISAKRRRGEELLAEIHRRMENIADAFYDIGESLLELQKGKLFAALGHTSFAAMLRERNVMSVSAAHRLIRIASTLSREKALLVGPVKAELLVGYAQATQEVDTPEWLLDNGKLPDGKPILDASTRELQAAIKKAKNRGPRKPKTPEEASARADAREAQATLRKRGAKGATVEAVKRGAEWWLRAEVPHPLAHLGLRIAFGAPRSGPQGAGLSKK